MNHDITHCNGKYEGFICSKHHTCLHYAQWLKDIILGREMLSHINAKPCIEENYKLYLEDKK